MPITTPNGQGYLSISDYESRSERFKNPKEAGRLASLFLSNFRAAQQERLRQERQWFYHLAFYFGQHHLKHREVKGSGYTDFYTPPAPYWKVRSVINQVRKVMRRDFARLTSQKPNAYVVPASTEDRDVFAAQAAEQIWDNTWRRKNLQAIIRDAVFWQTVCGNGFFKQYWDPEKYDSESQLEGDFCIESETPFHIYVPDLITRELEEQPYLFHARVVPIDWVRLNYNIEPTDKGLSYIDEHIYRAMGLNTKVKKTHTVMLEVWVKPGGMAEFKEGGTVQLIANQVVNGVEGPAYSHGEYPFTKLDAIPTGKFYTESVIADLINPQRELNRTRSQIVENKNLMGKPQLMAQRGSVNPTMITSEPGLVIPVEPGFDWPRPLPLQPLPSYITQEVERIYADIADLAGQHEVSEGKTPPGVTAAVAISYLQEQDETLLSPYFDSIEEGIQKTARQILIYAKDYWNEARTIRTAGIDRSFDVKAFLGSELGDNTDIRVEGGSALPTSRAAKQAFILDLMKMGFIEPQKGLEVMEIGGLNRIYEELQVDRRQAQRENLKMSVLEEEHLKQHLDEWMNKSQEERVDEQGRLLNPPLIISVNDFDNHAIHIEEHNKYRKSQAYENVSPEVKAQFEAHVRQHQEAQYSPINMSLPEQFGMPLGEEVNSMQEQGGEITSQTGDQGGQPPQQPPTEGMEAA